MRLSTLALVAALSFVGCVTEDTISTEVSPPSSTEDSLTTVTLAADRMMAVGTARVATHFVIDMRGRSLSMEGEGEVDIRDRQAHTTLTIEGLAPSRSVQTELLLDGFDIYVSSPILQSTFGIEEWVAADLRGFEGFTPEFDALGHLAHHDPSTAIHFLRGALEVEQLGQEEIRGADTTHYRVAVDLSSGNALPVDASESLGSSQFHVWRWTREDETISIHVWLDEQGLVRRQAMSLHYNAGSAAGMQLDVTTDLFDLGQEVDIDLPDREEFISLHEVRRDADA